MKIYISADMEGIAGVSTDPQRNPGNEDYQWARRLMTDEVNAAIAGACEAGAKEILVNDSHNTMDNLLPDRLDRRARLLSGNYKLLSMMEGFSQKYDAVMFIGYHAARGTAGAVMDHTYSEAKINTVRINGQAVGETMINGLLAGWFGVPLVLVSGDRALQGEVKKLNPEIETVVVKRAKTRYSVIHDHPEVACEKILAGVKKALSAPRLPKPLRLRPPYRFEIDFAHTHAADLCLRVPEVVKKGPRTVAFRQDDYLTAFKEFLALLKISYA